MSDAQQTPGFGANSWLVEEMYEQFRADPDSVAEAWQEFFEDYKPAHRGGDGETTTTTAESAVDGNGAKSATATVAAPAAAATQPAASAPAPVAAETRSRRARPRAPAGDEPAGELDQGRRQGDRHQHGAVAHGAHGDQLPQRPGEAARDQPQGDQRLSHPSAGPTKVSFTHLIGYAIVRAIADAVPNMNNTYVEGSDGTPRIMRNEHVNMSLAVDVEKKRRQPHPARARWCATPTRYDFAGFLAEYEEIIRKVRNNKLSPDDFAGATISLTNPGTIGTVQSVPRLMPGQGVIVGVGNIDYPAEFEGTDRANLSRARRVEGRHDHQHLRPPHHPGRRVGAVPQVRARAAARRARLLRGRVPIARHAVRGGQVASRRQPDRPRSGDARQADAGLDADPRAPRPRPPDRRSRSAALERAADARSSSIRPRTG